MSDDEIIFDDEPDIKVLEITPEMIREILNNKGKPVEILPANSKQRTIIKIENGKIYYTEHDCFAPDNKCEVAYGKKKENCNDN